MTKQNAHRDIQLVSIPEKKVSCVVARYAYTPSNCGGGGSFIARCFLKLSSLVILVSSVKTRRHSPVITRQVAFTTSVNYYLGCWGPFRRFLPQAQALCFEGGIRLFPPRRHTRYQAHGRHVVSACICHTLVCNTPGFK